MYSCRVCVQVCGVDTILSVQASGFVLHWAMLSLLSLLVANVQVTTRLASAACPAYYWYMALCLRSCRRGRWLVLAHVLGYAVCGTVAHVNFLPFV